MSLIASPIISRSCLLLMVLMFVCPPFWYINQHENKNTDSEATEANEEEPQAQVGATDVVETFKVCHTSRKKVMSDAATKAIVSPCTCSILSARLLSLVQHTLYMLHHIFLIFMVALSFGGALH